MTSKRKRGAILFTRFKSKTRKLFLDPYKSEAVEINKGEKLDIILSPSLYWVKKMKLPITNIREVKKLLPSIFEDTLPSSHYSYTAYKKGDEFFIFAYDDKKILDLLHKKEIIIAQIHSVHFAQTEFIALEGAVGINEAQAMYLKDEVLLLAPLEWMSHTQNLKLENIQLSKETIKLQQFGHIVDNNNLYKIGLFMMVLALIFVIEIFITSSRRDVVLDSKDTLFSKYGLQPTMMQNRSTFSKYNKIYETQMQLREYLSYFLSMKLEDGQKILLVDYQNKILYVTVSGVKKGASRAFFSQLDAKKLHYTTSFHGENVKVEIKL